MSIPNLELPLGGHILRVGAGYFHAGVHAGLVVGLLYISPVHMVGPDAAVVGALGPGVAALGPAERVLGPNSIHLLNISHETQSKWEDLTFQLFDVAFYTFSV